MNTTKYLLWASSLAVMLFVSVAQASLITVNDGDSFNYDATNTYYFDAVLSAANPTVTFGANVDPGESFIFTVSSPAEIDLLAALMTGPDGTGSVIVAPSSFTVLAGVSVDFPIDGNFFVGQTQWMTVSLDGIAGALSYLSTLPNGELPIGGFASSPNEDLSFFGGDGNGNGNGSGNGNGQTGQVPIPGPLPLLMIGGLALAAANRKKVA